MNTLNYRYWVIYPWLYSRLIAKFNFNKIRAGDLRNQKQKLKQLCYMYGKPCSSCDDLEEEAQLVKRNVFWRNLRILIPIRSKQSLSGK